LQADQQIFGTAGARSRPCRLLPVCRDGRLHVLRWGNRRGESRHLPCTAWTQVDPVEPGSVGPIDWVPATTPDEQERAIDDLISTWNTSPSLVQVQMAQEEFSPPRDQPVFRHLAPKSASTSQRRALQFAAE
jgi:hypothetical protein